MTIPSPNSSRNGMLSDVVERVSENTAVEHSARRSAETDRAMTSGAESSDQANVDEFMEWHGSQSLGVNDREAAVVNKRGAPALARPALGESRPDAMLRITLLGIESSSINMATATDSARAIAAATDKTREERLAGAKAHQAKLGEVAESQHTTSIWSWAGKIAAVIGAVVSVGVAAAITFFSGGGGLPLLIISTMALVSAAMSLANEVSGGRATLTKLISGTTEKLLEAVSVDKRTAEKIGNLMAGLAGLALPVLVLFEPQLVGALAQSICEMAGVSADNTQMIVAGVNIAASITVGVIVAAASILATGGTAAIPIAARAISAIVGGITTITTGGTSIGKGLSQMSTATKVNEAEIIRASNVQLEGRSTQLKYEMDDFQEVIKNLMKNVEDGVRAAAQVIRELFESSSQISNNIGRRSPA